MNQRVIGSRSVSAIGLGGMPLSIEGHPDRETAIATIHAALDAGITFIDTADAYHAASDPTGANEVLIAEALAARSDRDSIAIATKGGHYRPADGRWLTDGRPDHLRQAARDSARRLGSLVIQLYQFHRPDPEVPFEDSVGAIRDIVDDGLAVTAGISNVTVEQIRTAREILGERLVAVQNEYSPSTRASQPQLELCRELGLTFIPYRPLGGLSAAYADDGDYAVFHRIADAHGVSPARVSLAWLLAQGEHVVPIVGSRRPETIVDSAAAGDLTLDAAELAAIDDATAGRD